MIKNLVYTFLINKGNKDIKFDVDFLDITISIDDGDKLSSFILTKEELKALNDFINFVQIK